MRRAAAAGGRRLLLLQADVGPALAGPGAAHLSTSTPAASLWQQALKVAASVLPLGSGGAGGAGGLAAEAHPEAQQRRAQRAQQMHAAAATAPADVGAAVVPAAVPVVLTGSELRRAEPALSNSADDGSSEKSRRRARRRARAAAKAAKAGLAAELPSLQLSAAAAELHTAGGAVQQQQRGKRRRGKEQQPEQQQPQQPELAASPSPAGTAAAAAEQQQEAAAGGADGGSQLPPPLILQDDAHPIREVDISRPAWFILTRLRAAGHEAYVVGGTVRDLLLGGTPKDFDLLTSAEPHQVKALFPRCIVVGRSFPVCQVYAEGTMIEVSSFSTNADTRLIPADASVHMIGRQKPRNAQRRSREGATWAAARVDNAARRDFTVNGLLYDPFSRLLFDAVGGVADCEARRLRTICPPDESLTKDPARILRGLRLAARADLEIDAPTAAAMQEHAAAIGQLPAGRLQMELASLMGYGAARRSLALMWGAGLLDMLLPRQALYLKRQRVARAPRPGGVAAARRAREFLFELADELDKHVHPQKPIDPCVWVAMLAAPLVVEQCTAAAKQAAAAALQRELEAGSAGSGSDSSSSNSSSSSSSSSSDSDDSSSSSSSSSEDEAEAATASGSASEGEGGEGGDARSSGARGRRLRERLSSARPLSGGELPPEIKARLDYLERYGQVVSDVLDSMLQPLDAGTMALLGRTSKKHAAELQDAASGRPTKSRGKRHSAAEGSVLLPCVVPRAAADRAAQLLMLEADLRGRPELKALLERNDWPPPRHGSSGDLDADAADGAGGEPALGRHNHHLWQRLERAAGRVEGAADDAAAAAAKAGAPSEREQERERRRKARGRVLSAEELLVLGILSDPRWDYAGRTALG